MSIKKHSKSGKNILKKIKSNHLKRKDSSSAERSPEYIKGEIFFNPKGMFQLRINQFREVTTASPYKGENRKVNISQRLYDALKDQTSKNSHSKEYRKSLIKYIKNDINPINRSALSLDIDSDDEKTKRLLKEYKKSINKAIGSKDFVTNLSKRFQNSRSDKNL
ncbi:unnamed protein product [Moneuplotes crassus]|uniref:Uncharacterized protein n=1 Tax=Euplotes crassus TaxID=5936 RepID=A0AAD2CVG0_EUPCR|nr:unnamed protein product [Moneuplotes crassus]